MNYIVEPADGLWRIMVLPMGYSVGTIIHKRLSKSQALVTAKLLAGWRGTVTVINPRK